MAGRTKCYKISNPEITKNFNDSLLENPNYLRSVGFAVIEEAKKPNIDPKNEVIDLGTLTTDKGLVVDVTETKSTEEAIDIKLETTTSIIMEPTLESAREAYLEKFGKKAHPKAKLETILKKLEA